MIKFNREKVLQALELLHPDNEVFEIRILGLDGKYKLTYTGLFCEPARAVEELEHFNSKGRFQVYVTLHQTKWSIGDNVLDAKQQFNHIVRAGNIHDDTTDFSVKTTADADMVKYKWLFIDLDPIRDSGISSTDEEKEHARLLIDPIRQFLESNYQIINPVICDSGNGYHLLYRANYPATEENESKIKKLMSILSLKFSNDHVSIDTTVCNPARITKLYGTLACKGVSTETRPFRYSEVLDYGK